MTDVYKRQVHHLVELGQNIFRKILFSIFNTSWSFYTLWKNKGKDATRNPKDIENGRRQKLQKLM